MANDSKDGGLSEVHSMINRLIENYQFDYALDTERVGEYNNELRELDGYISQLEFVLNPAEMEDFTRMARTMLSNASHYYGGTGPYEMLNFAKETLERVGSNFKR